MVRRVFGFYLLRSIYGELRDRSHHIIVYFDLGFLHCLEDTKRYKDKAPGLKIRLIGNCVFRVASFGLWLGILFFVVFVGLGLLGSRKERKRKSAVIFRSASFSFSFFFLACSVTRYTESNVLLSDTPSVLLISTSSLSDPTSTSICNLARVLGRTGAVMNPSVFDREKY